jgi:excisionase family DNA binding protein
VNQTPRSYTTVDVAKRLGVSLQTVQRWVDQGHLKAWKTPGGHRRIDSHSAEQLFREQDALIGSRPAETPETNGAGPRPTAVIVDDDPVDRQLLVLLMQQALPEVRIEVAENGFQGLVIIGKTAPDVVVTDIHMPHIDGFAMLRSLMAGGETRPRKLIAVSALSADALRQHGEIPPGVIFFNKPIEHEPFIAALRA